MHHLTSHHINILDYALLCVVLLSVVISFTRGFIQEVVSLITWIVSGILAFLYFHDISDYLTDLIINETLRNIVSFIAILVVGLIIGAVINRLCKHVLEKSKLSLRINRLLGIAFGLLRGIVLAAIVAFIGEAGLLNESVLWQESVLIHYFQDLADYFVLLLPDNVRTYLLDSD